MGGVADDDDGGGVAVGLAFDADEREMGVLVELGDEIGRGDEGGHAGEVTVEVGGDVGAFGVCLELFVKGHWGEEGAGE